MLLLKLFCSFIIEFYYEGYESRNACTVGWFNDSLDMKQSLCFKFA